MFSVNTGVALVLGWGGKTAINVFLLITGYFMCKQQFKWSKVINLYLQMKFYRIVIYLIFLLTGYELFSLKECYKAIFGIAYGFGKGFGTSFLGLYVLVPFINKLLSVLNKKELEKLILLLLIMFTFFSSFMLNSTFEYIGWYVTVYLIGAYIRFYPLEWTSNLKVTGLLCVLMLILSWASVLSIMFVSVKLNRMLPYYWFVADSNKILAILTAIGLFLFFKNLKMGSIKIVNTFAASTFGVLLIHASSDTMRRWLWRDVCKNVEHFQTNSFIVHIFVCTICVYFVCVTIDIIRKYLLKQIIAAWGKFKEKES